MDVAESHIPFVTPRLVHVPEHRSRRGATPATNTLLSASTALQTGALIPTATVSPPALHLKQTLIVTYYSLELI